MRTQMMIMLVVVAVGVACLAVVAGLVSWMGWVGGLLTSGVLALATLGTYSLVVKPWHLRWGATDDEVAMAMPGDQLIPDASSATRAISIHAPTDAVWPWLVQVGYGKAGWYSYDWIDNDFRASAGAIMPEFQSLGVGDKILMMPTMGFVVDAVDPPRSIVSVLEDGSTSWCLLLIPTDDGSSRLVSRWRPKFEKTLATFFMTMLAEPGTFIMEQKMLRTLRDRVEAHQQSGASI